MAHGLKLKQTHTPQTLTADYADFMDIQIQFTSGAEG
jgi:hypothetical protein